MALSKVYLLLINQEVLLASRNITVLAHSLFNRCKADGASLPLPYYSIRRKILATGKYVHDSAIGIKYSIIERSLVKKPVQHRLTLFEDAEVKQTAEQGCLPEG
jgi:hypothetical protein